MSIKTNQENKPPSDKTPKGVDLREIRNHFRFIPFGKFSLSGRGVPPFNQVFVGRQRERVNLIEKLTHQEQFGAILVSGQRGAGKTAFVRECLSEYQRDSYHRSIRFTRARDVQDFLIVTVLGLITCFALMLLVEANELLAQNALETLFFDDLSKQSNNYLTEAISWAWIPLIALSLTAIPIFYYGHMGIRAISQFQEPMPVRLGTNIALSFTSVALIFLWLTPLSQELNSWLESIFEQWIHISRLWSAIYKPFERITDLNSFFSFVISATFLIRIYASIVNPWPTSNMNQTIFWRLIGTIIRVLIAALCVWFYIILLEISSYYSFIFMGIFYICLGFVKFSGRHIIRWISNVSKRYSPVFISVITIFLFCIYVITFLLFSHFLLWPRLVGTLEEQLPDESLIRQLTCIVNILFIVVPLYVIIYDFFRFRYSNSVKPVSGGSWVIFLKSVTLFSIGFCVALPIIRVLSILTSASIYDSIPVKSTLGSSWITYLPSFDVTHINIGSMMYMTLALFCIYFLEYERICRDQHAHRVDAQSVALGRSPSFPQSEGHWQTFESKKRDLNWLEKFIDNWHNFVNGLIKAEEKLLSPDQRKRTRRSSYSNEKTTSVGLLGPNKASLGPKWSLRRDAFRKLERATLPFLIYSERHPTLSIWVNLGFDNLDHARIIEAMLTQLRGVYKRRFLNPTTLTGFANFTLLVLTVAILTSVASKSLFNINYIENNSAEIHFETAEIGLVPRFGETDYCAFFEIYPEYSPNIKSLICALPYSNALLELAYSPILTLRTDFVGEGLREVSSHEGDRNDEEVEKEFGLLSWDKVHGSEPPIGDVLINMFREFGPISWDRDLGLELAIGDTLIDIFREFGLLFWGKVRDPKHQTVSTLKNMFGVDITNSFLVRIFLDQNLGLPRLTAPIDRVGLFQTRQIRYAYHPSFQEQGTTQISDEGFDIFRTIERKGQPTLRAYHLLLYVAFFSLIMWLNRWTQIVPYQAVIKRMDDLLMLIRSHEVVRSQAPAIPGLWGRLLSFGNREQSFSTPSDSRLVEQNFIELLNGLRPFQSSWDQSAWTRGILGIKPEISFIFDEMDKLSGAADAESVHDQEKEASIEENTRERLRSTQLHRLLSDMKRLISDGSARFIFIGGRLYHDEWLADMAQRTPILNSVFSGQIYLPSLLADHTDDYGRLNDRIAEYVVLMHRNSMHRLDHWHRARQRRFRLPPDSAEEPTYLQSELPIEGHPRRFAALVQLAGIRVYRQDGEFYGSNGHSYFSVNTDQEDMDFLSQGELETLDQFINYLTYRSAGNPKKLQELMDELMQPMSSALALPRRPRNEQTTLRWRYDVRHRGHDALIFDDSTLYRIQFIDMVYRHLTDWMEGRMLMRDDKVSMSLFYLMDFLLKFHNRSFSWTSLQRVDELSHIHRAPDLRSVMRVLVETSSERFLHRVLNGVYAYRFRSDFAREIDYLSRKSKEEMAALNFTLDESQSLKGLYQQTMHTGERENADTVSGLGELYEYDQEYEVARNYYRRAISLLDQHMLDVHLNQGIELREQTQQRENRWTGATAHERDRSSVSLSAMGILQRGSDEDVRRLASGNMSWLVARLRLLLQVGHTYDQEQNYERAAATFMHTARICERVQRAFADIETFKDLIDFNSFDAPAVNPKTLAVFYQAALALAWIKEKDPDNLEESLVYAEAWLSKIYQREPILLASMKHMDEFTSFHPITSANILLQVSTYHDRLGDLYFFKGKPSLRSLDFSPQPEAGSSHGTSLHDYFSARTSAIEAYENVRKGHLPRAHYHYALAYWSVVKYLKFREITSKHTHAFEPDGDGDTKKLSVWSQDAVHPDLVQNVLSDCLSDLSENVAANISPIMIEAELYIRKVKKHHPIRTGGSRDSLVLTTIDKMVEIIENVISRSVREFCQSHSECCFHESTKFVKLDWNFDDKSRESSGIGDLLSRIKAYFDLYGTSYFFGTEKPSQLDNKDTYANPIQETILEFGPTPSATNQVLGYKLISDVAIQSHVNAGHNINAANELLIQADILTNLIWNSRLLNHISDFSEHNKSNDLHKSQLQRMLQEAIRVGNRTSDADKPLKSNEMQQDTWRFIQGSLAFSSIERSFRQMRISHRSSSTRMRSNHGNPSSDEFKKLKKCANPLDKKKYDILKGRSFNEAHTDYDLSQGWRDDPRGITQACSLALALLDPENPGALATGLALKIYRETLIHYARDAFAINKDPDELLSETNKPLVVLVDAYNAHGDLTNCTIQDKELKDLSSLLVRVIKRGLRIVLERYRYPILNRLEGLKVLIDSSILCVSKEDFSENQNGEEVRNENARKGSQIGRFARELLNTAEIYDSELHFPAHKIGTSLSLVYLYMEKHKHPVFYDDLGDMNASGTIDKDVVPYLQAGNSIGDKDPRNRPLLNDVIFTRESVGESALNLLRRGEQMFSQGKAYYENIAHLNYLNDDFNDRSIHSNQAINMMNAEITALLAGSVHNLLFKD